MDVLVNTARAAARSRHVDVVVIGGGVVGAAAAAAVARPGRRVTVLERSSLSVARGSSKGGARIFAPVAYPDRSYLDMDLRALSRWRELERESGERLLLRTGGLTRGAFAERELPALRAAGVEANLVSSREAMRRFGVSVPEGSPLLHQPDAGVILADRARSALLDTASAAGVELRGNERVRSIADSEDLLEVETDGGAWRCSAAIVAAGPWSRELLARAGIELPLRVSCQSVAYFGLRDPAARPVALMEFDGDEPYACWDPVHGMKAALHSRGPSVSVHDDPLEVEQEAIDRVVEWVGAAFPGAVTGLAGVEPCVYTNTPDERFLIERRGRIIVGSACNGQGFQFAPETGKRLAQLAVETAALSVARRRRSRR